MIVLPLKYGVSPFGGYSRGAGERCKTEIDRQSFVLSKRSRRVLCLTIAATTETELHQIHMSLQLSLFAERVIS